jgi:streptomycin 6-kinase
MVGRRAACGARRPSFAIAGLDPRRIFRWILAYAGLGVARSLESGHDPGPATAEIAVAEFGV